MASEIETLAPSGTCTGLTRPITTKRATFSRWRSASIRPSRMPMPVFLFTHWQNAFQGWAERGPEAERTYAVAEQSRLADDRDPAAHWAMGRALWLRRRHDQCILELEQAVELSPNFALAHYNLAFVNSTTGYPKAAVPSSNHAGNLSPFHPMLFGMLGARAMALVRLGRFEEAAEWRVKAAARPNAFAHISAIAASSLGLAGRVDDGCAQVAGIRRTLPHYRVGDLVNAMHFMTPMASAPSGWEIGPGAC